MNAEIEIPTDLKARIDLAARERGMSFNDFVTESIRMALAEADRQDPLFTDTAVYEDHGATDTAAKHDDWLYGDAS